MRTTKTLSFFIGFSFLMFGVLKFVNPFKTWYSIQVLKSGLGEASYSLGIAGEIIVGALLISTVMFRSKLTSKTFSILIVGSSIAAILMMTTAIFVHLQPEVPADVLPLKIKPPIIPTFFLFLSLFNIFHMVRQPGV